LETGSDQNKLLYVSMSGNIPRQRGVGETGDESNKI